MNTQPIAHANPNERESQLARFEAVRAQTELLASPLALDDYGLQSMPECSPPKWHLAHTSWFFEQFVLRPRGLRPFHRAFAELFNSYYEAVGPRVPRGQRGLLSRPTVEEVYRYRAHVDAAIAELMPQLGHEALDVIELGLQHEQQHQELVLTDLKHAFFQNPLRPEYHARSPRPDASGFPMHWLAFDGGIHCVGHGGRGFAFDNEGPCHKILLEPFQLASRPVTCGEFLEFMEHGGYDRPELWLSDGWALVQQHSWRAPLYWEREGDSWQLFTLHGMQPLDPDEPVCHVSHFEADAFARWSHARLPTELEWEVAACDARVTGNFLESARFHPTIAPHAPGLSALFGDAWTWTASAYLPYPGFRAEGGALGEYNAKFMSGQMVLRGGSCATPRAHVRATYRNFWPPSTRHQFSGIRLAR